MYIKLLYRTLEADTMLYVDYMLIKLEKTVIRNFFLS